MEGIGEERIGSSDAATREKTFLANSWIKREEEPKKKTGLAVGTRIGWEISRRPSLSRLLTQFSARVVFVGPANASYLSFLFFLPPTFF
jgi:hypothetical protein